MHHSYLHACDIPANNTGGCKDDPLKMVWEMSRTTNKILFFGIILILAILAALVYCGIITFPYQ